MPRGGSRRTPMADHRQRLSFRLPSFLAPTRRAFGTRRPNHPAAPSTPNTRPANTPSPAARLAHPADKTRTAQQTPSKPPERASQTSTPQPQASKPNSLPPSQAPAANPTPVGQQTSSSSSNTTTPAKADPRPSNVSNFASQPTSSSATTSLSSTKSSSAGQQTSPPTVTAPPKVDPHSLTMFNSASQQTRSSTTSTSAGQPTSSPKTARPSQADPPSSTASHSAGNQASSSPAATPFQQNSSSAATAATQANQRSSDRSSSVGQHASNGSVNDIGKKTTNEEVKHHSSPSKTSHSVNDFGKKTNDEEVKHHSSPNKTSQFDIGNKTTDEEVKHHSSPSKTSQAVPHDSSHHHHPTPKPHSHGWRKAHTKHDEKESESEESTQEEGPGSPNPTRRSNSSSRKHQMNPNEESDIEPDEAKELPEILQNAKKESKQDVSVVQSMESDTTEKIKEAESNGVQSKNTLTDKQVAIGLNKMAATPTPDHLKQDEAAPTDLQPTNKEMIGDSHQQPVTFKEIPIHKQGKDSISTLLRTKTAGNSNFPTDEIPVSVITLAGENRGASMQLGSESSNRGRTLHIHRSYKLNRNESPEAATDGESSSKQTEPKDQKEGDDHPQERYINSNIMGINNSILFKSSVSEKSPGVYVVHALSSPKSIKTTEGKTHPETRNIESTKTPSQKLTYEPTVRRRCLRGLLLESSDSDQDNPEKPRRHGCRVSCNANIN